MSERKAIPARQEACAWTYCDGESSYRTTCGETFCFTEGRAEDNGVHYCHHCGGLVRFVYQCDECDAVLTEPTDSGLCAKCFGEADDHA